jgi:hypothetical protein
VLVCPNLWAGLTVPAGIWKQHANDCGTFKPYWFPQRLDHFNPGIFAEFQWFQRYFVNDKYWDGSKTAPVFLYINGEGPVGGPPCLPTDEVVLLAQAHKGLIVTLEHRFYGESQPFNLTTTENLMFLSSKQALADLADFRQFVAANWQLADNVPFVTIGGSYSGALSAWFRIKYPHLTTMSISSSGVVNAILNFTAFDAQVATSAGPQCTEWLQSITAMLEERLSSSSSSNRQTKAAFDVADMYDGDFYYLMADAQATSVQYGFMTDMCGALAAAVNDNDNNNVDADATVASNDTVLWNAWVKYVNGFWKANLTPDFWSYATQDQVKLEPTPSRNYRPWWWQKCTELAYFQVAPAVNAVRSKHVTLAWHLQHCRDLFGEDLPLPPPTAETNTHYGGNKPAGTNIYFVNGSEDPWQHASLPTSQSTVTQPCWRIDCDNCGHCVDLRGCPEGGCHPPSVLTDGRARIFAQIQSWLQAL